LSLSRHTERTVTSVAALRGSLADVRKTGVCVTIEELVPGASGIAAPIFDRQGRVAGACAIGGPTDRVRPRLRSLAAEVKATTGAPLVRLDPRDLEVKVHQARAALATAQGRLRAAAAGVPMTEGTTRSQIGVAEASAARAVLGIDGAARALDERRSKLRARTAAVQAAQAEVAARQADFDRAGLDRGRTAELLERKLVARQDFDHADNAFKTAGSALEAARQRLDVAHAEVAQAEAEVATQEVVLAQSRRQREEAEHTLGDARSRRGEVTVRSAEAASAEAQLAEARAALREAELNLEYTTIAAPVSGRVTRRTVEVGQTVQPGQPLLAVVDVANVWVVANYKETQ